MKVLSVGWNTFQETGKYTCATAEYFSLFSYSLLKRSGSLVTHGVCRITSPVAAVISRPFSAIKKKSPLSFRKKKQRAERVRKASENRARAGRKKGQRQSEEKEKETTVAFLEQHRLENDGDGEAS